MAGIMFGKGIRLASMVWGGIANWWHEYSKAKMGVVGLFILCFLVVMLVGAPIFATHDPSINTIEKTLPPSLSHLFGTDVRGRDLFSMNLYAGRISMFVGIITAATIISTGTIVGLIAGYFGGIIDDILMRIADILMVLPRLPLLIVMAALLNPGIPTIMMILAILGWTRPARQIRALTLSIKNYDYIESTRSSGGSSLHIIFHHVFPNVSGVVVAHFVMETVLVILLETGLSFLGFGDPLRFTWGQILYWAQSYAAFSSGWWWWWLPTGLFITALCFSLAFIGTTLNDRFVLKLNIRGKE